MPIATSLPNGSVCSEAISRPQVKKYYIDSDKCNGSPKTPLLGKRCEDEIVMP